MLTNLAIDDRLIDEARKLGRHRTKNETVTAALGEYIKRPKQQEILPLVGTIEYSDSHDYVDDPFSPRIRVSGIMRKSWE